MRILFLLVLLCFTCVWTQTQQYTSIYGNSAFGHFGLDISASILHGYVLLENLAGYNPDHIDVVVETVYFTTGTSVYTFDIPQTFTGGGGFSKLHLHPSAPVKMEGIAQITGPITKTASIVSFDDPSGSRYAFTDGYEVFVAEGFSNYKFVFQDEGESIKDITWESPLALIVLVSNNDMIRCYGTTDMICTPFRNNIAAIHGECFLDDNNNLYKGISQPSSMDGTNITQFQCHNNGLVLLEDGVIRVVGQFTFSHWFLDDCSQTRDLYERNSCIFTYPTEIVQFHMTPGSIIAIGIEGDIYESGRYYDYNLDGSVLKDKVTKIPGFSPNQTYKITAGSQQLTVNHPSPAQSIVFIYNDTNIYTANAKMIIEGFISFFPHFSNPVPFAMNALLPSRIESMVFGPFEVLAVLKNRQIYRWGSIDSTLTSATSIPTLLHDGKNTVGYPIGMFSWDTGYYIFYRTEFRYLENESKIQLLNDAEILHVAPSYWDNKILLFTEHGLTTIPHEINPSPIQNPTSFVSAIVNVDQVSFSDTNIVIRIGNVAYCRGDILYCCYTTSVEYLGGTCGDQENVLCSFVKMEIENVTYVHTGPGRSFFVTGDGKLHGCGTNDFSSVYPNGDLNPDSLMEIDVFENVQRVWTSGATTIVEIDTGSTLELRSYSAEPGRYVEGAFEVAPTIKTLGSQDIPLKSVVGSTTATAFIYETLAECNYHCNLTDIQNPNTTIEVYGGAVITNNSRVVVRLDFGEPVIWNLGDEPVVVEGGELVVVIDDWEALYQTLTEDPDFSMNIIVGSYEGSFDNILLEGNTGTRCEKIVPMLSNQSNQMSVAFIIDDNECGAIPWWGILLIVIGAIAIISVIVVVVLLKTKTCRDKVVPYRRKR